MPKKEADAEKTYKLGIGRPIEMLGPDKEGVKGLTIGQVIVQMIPGLAQQDNERAIRIWRIGMTIDAGKDEFLELSEIDFKMLKTLLLSDQRPIWVKANLMAAFQDAEERAGASTTDD